MYSFIITLEFLCAKAKVNKFNKLSLLLVS